MKNVRFTILTLFVSALVFIAGCKKSKQVNEKNAAIPSDITKAEIVRGPMTFRIKVNKDKIDLRDKLTMIIEAEAPEKYSFQFPPFGEGLEAFGVLDYHTQEPLLTSEKKILYKRTYLLDPLLSDIHKIPPIKAIFQEKASPSKKYELETEPFNIEVSLPPKDFWTKLDIDDKTALLPEESLNPFAKRKLYWIFETLGTLLLIVIIILLIHYYRRKKQSPPPKIPAHIIALAALKKLLDEDLIEQNRTKEFYSRISDILRTYIENRFEIKAPEYTTQEFLQKLTTAQTFIKQQKKLLAHFLEHCDLVKFAEHQPDDSEIQKTFDACKNFIAETQEVVVS
ncbi:MAG: DUF4381 family protein [Lentisphaeria bacterium]